MPKQRAVLKDKAHTALRTMLIRDFQPIEGYVALVRVLQARKNSQQGGLAATPAVVQRLQQKSSITSVGLLPCELAAVTIVT